MDTNYLSNGSGDIVNLQVSTMGSISNLSTADFTLGTPFLIKNDDTSSVSLEVNLWRMDPTTFVTTNFSSGWNPELVRSIKSTSTTTNLKYGY